MERRLYPYDMTQSQQLLFSTLDAHFNQLGYVIRSEPLEGMEQNWLDGLQASLENVETKLVDINKAFKTRGSSRAALYYLHTSPGFDAGFGLHTSAEQMIVNRRYKKHLDRAVARWNENG